MNTLADEHDWGYDANFIRSILEVWHLIEALREKGSYIIDPILAATSNNRYDKDDYDKEQAIRSWSVPKRKSNSVYRVDDVGSIVCDIEQALDHSISPRQKERLMLHYLYGYEYAEIAKMEGEESNEEAVKVACWRAINKMAEWLEEPVAPKPDAYIKPHQDQGYRRKYTSIPQYA